MELAISIATRGDFVLGDNFGLGNAAFQSNYELINILSLHFKKYCISFGQPAQKLSVQKVLRLWFSKKPKILRCFSLIVFSGGRTKLYTDRITICFKGNCNKFSRVSFRSSCRCLWKKAVLACSFFLLHCKLSHFLFLYWLLGTVFGDVALWCR